MFIRAPTSHAAVRPQRERVIVLSGKLSAGNRCHFLRCSEAPASGPCHKSAAFMDIQVCTVRTQECAQECARMHTRAALLFSCWSAAGQLLLVSCLSAAAYLLLSSYSDPAQLMLCSCSQPLLLSCCPAAVQSVSQFRKPSFSQWLSCHFGQRKNHMGSSSGPCGFFAHTRSSGYVHVCAHTTHTPTRACSVQTTRQNYSCTARHKKILGIIFRF